MTPKEFHDWFENPIAALNSYAHGGFAVLMIAIPLAERYFREKSGTNEGTLGSPFYLAFTSEFTNLTEADARHFWSIYRNGLVHQATFSTATTKGSILPKGWITAKTNATPHAININGNEFVVLPKEFSEKIVMLVRNDPATFEAPGSANHPMPLVRPLSSSWGVNDFGGSPMGSGNQP